MGPRLIGITVLAQVVGTRFQNKFTSGNTPSQQAANILSSRFPAKSGDTADVVFHTTAPVTDAANRAAVAQVVQRISPLAMDYEVFLLSRIREEWLRTGDNSLAVADGLAVTGRIITAATTIMFCVFASFIINDPLHILKVFGLGLATAVAVDVTLVRMVLVPSLMEVLGRANWWMPHWLERSVPRLGGEVAPAAP